MIASVATVFALLFAAPPPPHGDTLFYPPLRDLFLADCRGETAARDSIPCRLRLQWNASDVHARLRGPSGTWVERDDVTFVVESPYAAFSARVAGSIVPMAHLPGTDLWIVTLRVPHAERALFGYEFLSADLAAGERPRGVFRGSNAPSRALAAGRLAGRVSVDTVGGAALGERRSVFSYVPPTRDGRAITSVVYVADGQIVPLLAPLVDTLVTSGALPPTALVGIASAARPDRRNAEYTLGASADSSAFFAAERWLLAEVMPEAERRLGVGPGVSRTMLGMSSGAAFAVTVGARNPGRFRHIIGLSPAGYPPVISPGVALPTFTLTSGTLEPMYMASTAAIAQRLRSSGAAVRYDVLIAGHDQEAWLDVIPRLLIR